LISHQQYKQYDHWFRNMETLVVLRRTMDETDEQIGALLRARGACDVLIGLLLARPKRRTQYQEKGQ
jgi:hypothetical protein